MSQPLTRTHSCKKLLMLLMEFQLLNVLFVTTDSPETVMFSSALWDILYVEDVIREYKIAQNVEDRWLEDVMILNSSCKHSTFNHPNSICCVILMFIKRREIQTMINLLQVSLAEYLMYAEYLLQYLMLSQAIGNLLAILNCFPYYLLCFINLPFQKDLVV